MRLLIILVVFILLYIIIQYYLSTYFKQEIIVEGIRENNIYLGQTINMASKNAIAYSDGIILAFQMVNRLGGINGYKLNLFVYDDNYDSEKSVRNAKILLDYDNVFGLIGSWGTSQSYSVYDKVIGSRNIPFISTNSGSSLLRDSNNNCIILRPPYKSELEFIIQDITYRNLKNIAVIYQKDDFGISCFNDLLDLYSNGFDHINIIPGTYESNSVYLYDSYKEILNGANPYYNNSEREKAVSNIDAVIIIATSLQQEYIIKYFKTIKPDMYFYNMSNVGENLSKITKLENKSNIYLTQILNVNQTNHPELYNAIINELEYSKYKNLFTKKEITLNDNLIEGFITGMFCSNVLKKLDKITRENFINEIYKYDENFFDIFDVKLGPFISNEDYASGFDQHIYLTKFNEITNRYDIISEKKI
jgi:branched-chain amino acid transport system substrate-binding protein